MKDLVSRLDKAEQDRMHKYYGQVSKINDWVNSVKQKVEESAQTCAAVQNYFHSEHQIYTLNTISETLTKCLTGHDFNKMVNTVKERQEFIGKKKLLL